MRARSSQVNGKRWKRIPRRAEKDSCWWRITVRGSPGRIVPLLILSLFSLIVFKSVQQIPRRSGTSFALADFLLSRIAGLDSAQAGIDTVASLYHSSIQCMKHVLSWSKKNTSSLSNLNSLISYYYFWHPQNVQGQRIY